MLLFEHEKQQFKLKGENNEEIIRSFLYNSNIGNSKKGG